MRFQNNIIFLNLQTKNLSQEQEQNIVHQKLGVKIHIKMFKLDTLKQFFVIMKQNKDSKVLLKIMKSLTSIILKVIHIAQLKMLENPVLIN